MTRISEQLPLDLAPAPQTGREDLIVSEAIAPAVALIDGWPRWPSPVTVLTGPAGSGKSHLAAIWAEVSGAERLRPQGDVGEAGRQRPVLFEDADRGTLDETALFHLINTVRQNGTALMMTARQLPAAWAVSLPDLRSRLKAATVVPLGAPDDLLLSQVLIKLFSDRQLAVDDRLVDYMVARMERSLDAARRLVEEIDCLALARSSRITRALIAEVLGAAAGRDAVD
ncbi:hypothetical protein BJF93_16755 [Xaviernesmea oryzae]|uniref:Chromosomal replication initiator protein DnaA domain-containing protein n=1 Tax=Xaviernesmea oryzae TaxID=464029 RepID=A0A1Q9ASV4_9HYPH|nr:DnaA regulatory inactivator HdaA [Xaviernesmea oryzae]OLP58514.1 hypothetical protein BJF93_16755 [Xaviernesmea oryzae]SEK60060.1 hypothetical protein SAMN04487976_10355 [Xaviernesmea oryzae]